MPGNRTSGRVPPRDMTVNANSIDQYLAAVPEPGRATLSKIRAAALAAAPREAVECFSYGMPAIKYKRPLIAYAAFAKHCGIYPMSAAVIETLKADLAAYPTSKGAIRVPIDKAPPAALIRKLIKARLAEIEGG